MVGDTRRETARRETSGGEPGSDQEREQWLLAEARSGSAWALAALEAHYRPMVLGYLACLTGNTEAARPLARDTLAGMEEQLSGHHGAPSLPAWLLLSATDAGLAYLRHVRALQLAGLSAAPRVSPPRRAGPTAWLRAAFERFTPSRGADRRVAGSRVTMLERGVRTSPRRGEPPPTRRVRPNELRSTTGSADSRDTLRRRILRAVLADLAPEDARCLALHLVTGLSHPEVAYVSGLGAPAARASIIQGLELFAVRYDEALELLGISPSVFDAEATTRPGLAPVAYQGTQTLQSRGAATPTLHSDRDTRARALPTTTPRSVVRTLPMPSAARSARAIPVRTPAPAASAAVSEPASVAVLSPQPRLSYQGGATLRRQDSAPTNTLRANTPHASPRRATAPPLSAGGRPALFGDAGGPPIPPARRDA